MAAKTCFAIRKDAIKIGWAAAIAGALGLTSCAVGPDFRPPQPPNIGSFTPDRLPATSSADGKTQRVELSDQLPAEWWELFHSHALNALVVRALHDNPNVDAAQAAMRAAQANVYAEVGTLFPLATANYNFVGGKVSNEVSSPLANNNPYYSIHTGQLSVTYVPDIWGGTRWQIENLEALKVNQRFTNEATFLTLTSSIALGAIQEAALRAQINITERLITISKEILAKVELQKNQGQVSGLDVAAQEALVAQTEATLPPLRKALAIQRDALIVLSGHLPGEGLPERFEFSGLQLPRNLPVTLPSDLIALRPDVRAAEANIHAACALIGVAISNRLPQFSLQGDIGRSGTKFADLFSNNPAFFFYTGMINATQTLFDGFTLQQRQRAAEAGLDQARRTISPGRADGISERGGRAVLHQARYNFFRKGSTFGTGCFQKLAVDAVAA